MGHLLRPSVPDGRPAVGFERESLRFEGPGGGRGRLRGHTVRATQEARDGMAASGTEAAMSHGHERLEEQPTTRVRGPATTEEHVMPNTLHVTAPEGVPFVDYEREFDVPAAELFRAHADPELYRQWIGPRGLETRIDGFDCRSGGSYRFVQRGQQGGDEYAFRGIFHTVRQDAFIVQTFEFEGWPDVVTLEYSTFEDLPGGRSRLSGRSVHPSLEAREQYLSTGMESGMSQGYDQLEELLTGRPAQDGS